MKKTYEFTIVVNIPICCDGTGGTMEEAMEDAKKTLKDELDWLSYKDCFIDMDTDSCVMDVADARDENGNEFYF